MKINFNINLTRKQQEAYDIMHKNDCRFLVARWSRQCGKTIFAEILVNNKDTLGLLYRLVMLLDKEYEPVFDKRVDKAFRDFYDDKKNKKDFERFNDYVRGGVEIIYEELLGNPLTSDDDKVVRLKNLVDQYSKFDGGIRDLIKTIDI